MSRQKILPYVFNGTLRSFLSQRDSLMPMNPISSMRATRYLGADIYKNFSDAYTNTLKALADQDLEYLEQIMEQRLYNVTKSCIQEINDRNLRIHYIEPEQKVKVEEGDEDEEGNQSEKEEDEGEEQQQFEKKKEKQQSNNKIGKILQNYFGGNLFVGSEHLLAEKDMKILLEAHGVFGLDINRNLNKTRDKYTMFPLVRGFKEFYFDFQNIKNVYDKNILILNVYFKTQRKLYITDSEDQVIYGSDSINKVEVHNWRFETYSTPIDWVLTDMDHFLKGNPYCKQEGKLEEEEQEDDK